MIKKFNLLILIIILFSLPLKLLSKNILIINSYHQTLTWTDSLVKNIINNLENEKFFIEYMDSKRFPREKIFKIFKFYIKEKYKNTKIDIIVVTDNNALTFVVKNKNYLFKDIPVLFCGINNFSQDMLEGYNDITGVVEGVDIKGTIEAILKLHPNIKNIVAVMGSSFTSQIYYYKITKLEPLYSQKISILILNGKFFSKKELANKLKNLPERSVILYLNLFHLKDGSNFGIEDGIQFIYKNSQKPIYTCWDVTLNFPGVVGGKITSSRLQALSVVNFAKKILYENIPVTNLKIITKPPTEYIFDYKVLKQFGININNFPFEYKLVNKPLKVYKKLEEKEHLIFIFEVFLIILGILIFVLIYNIRKRKIIEKQLESENLQFLTLLDGINDIIILKDPEGKWKYANKITIDFFKLKDIDYIGKTSEELIKLTHFRLSSFNKNIPDKKAWEQRKPIRYVLPLEDYNGNQIYIDIIKIPVFNADNSKKALIVAGRDITNYKKIQDNLIITQKMDTVGKIAGGIAHDFNNILTVISTNAELCSMFTKENDKINKYIKNITYASERAALLIRHLLAFAKQDISSQIKIELNTLIKSIVKLLKPSIPEDITFSFVLQEEPINIFADAIHIEQIITNLVLNAKDAVNVNQKKEKVISIYLNKTFIDQKFLESHNINLSEGNFAVISVKDNGCGIDNSIKEKIFDPFFTTKSSDKGTGLGLTTVFSLVEKNNGFLLFDSSLNEGTTFYIYFPIIDKISKGIDEEKDNILKKENIKFDLNVLFVEDNQEILQLIDESFKNLFKNFIQALNGEDALNKISGFEKDIDILITDIVMPKMDGIELAKRLKKINDKIKIIFVSGYDSGKLKEKLAFDYTFLYKPYKFDTLANIIQELFSEKNRGGQNVIR